MCPRILLSSRLRCPAERMQSGLDSLLGVEAGIRLLIGLLQFFQASNQQPCQFVCLGQLLIRKGAARCRDEVDAAEHRKALGCCRVDDLMRQQESSHLFNWGSLKKVRREAKPILSDQVP